MNDRPKAKELLNSLYDPLAALEKGAARSSLLDEEILRDTYISAMRGELDLAKLVMDLPCPEYWWDAHNATILRAMQIGNVEQARKWIDDARARAVREAQRVEAILKGKLDVAGYLQSWGEKTDTSYAAATRIDAPPKMTGDLSDPLWKQATVIGGFADGDAKPDDRTEVRLLYTSDALYVGFTCFESNMDKLVAARTARGMDIWEDDAVEVRINTDGLLFPNYQFGANALGVQYDAATTSNGSPNTAWKPDWQVKTARAADRWTAEYRIPFRTLSVALPPNGCLWMCNFCRLDHANAEANGTNYQISSYGAKPGGSFHNTAKFRPVWFR
jgi:hypothetical protein